MKRRIKQWKQWVLKKWDLPADALLDVPRITMIGDVHMYVENHRGVLHFSKQEIRLRLTHGQLLVRGKDFVIKSILPEEFLLEGIIEDIRYITEE